MPRHQMMTLVFFLFGAFSLLVLVRLLISGDLQPVAQLSPHQSCLIIRYRSHTAPSKAVCCEEGSSVSSSPHRSQQSVSPARFSRLTCSPRSRLSAWRVLVHSHKRTQSIPRPLIPSSPSVRRQDAGGTQTWADRQGDRRSAAATGVQAEE